MIAAAPLGNVVEQHGKIQHAPRNDLVDDRGAERMVLAELAILDPGEQPDGADGVLVDGVVVIHVELHLRDDAAESGMKRPKTPVSFIQRSTVCGSRGLVSTLRNSALARGSLRTLAVIRTASRLSARMALGWISSSCLSASAKISIIRTGSSRRKSSLGEGDAPRVEHEPVELARLGEEARHVAPAALGHLVVEMGEEHAGQVADRLRGQEIEMHEALDRKAAASLGETHAPGDLDLQVEGEAVLGPFGDIVHVAAHRPEEILGALELAQLGRRQQPDRDEIGDRRHLVHIFADPEQRVQVAQAALAFLDIGLDDIAAVAHQLVARLALGELSMTKMRAVSRITWSMKRLRASSNVSRSPQMKRASRRAVRIVRSDRAMRIVSSIERLECPILRPRSQST